jgi:hypothetical protein
MSAFGGVKRTWLKRLVMSAFDPKRTLVGCLPAPSVAPYVTLDNRLNVLPPLDPSGGLLPRLHI